MSTNIIKTHLDEIIAYLVPFKALINCHMVDFLVEKHWTNLIPAKIQEEIELNGISSGINSFLSNQKFTKLDSFNELIQNTKKYHLDNFKSIVLPQNEFELLLNTKCVHVFNCKEFMTAKKNHEVHATAMIVNNMIKSYEKDERIFVVDIGDGKGYLSSHLSLEYGFPVLGLEANENISESALKRNQKLKSAWCAIKKKQTPEKIENNSSDINQNSKFKTYISVNNFVTAETNFKRLIEQNFDTDNEQFDICLTGLHTCGDLSASALKAFCMQDSLKILINVGCCYHLLSENQKLNKITKAEDQQFSGFPLSKFLKGKNFSLNRNARMLALQSVQRTKNNCELPNPKLFYRALLEVIFKNKRPDLKNSIQIGKIKNINSFIEYYKKCDRKFCLGLSTISDEYIEKIIKEYDKEKQLLNLFYLIRMNFAPVIEAIILLDRLLFLQENHIPNSFIVRLFDPLISPRCYAVLALK